MPWPTRWITWEAEWVAPKNLPDSRARVQSVARADSFDPVVAGACGEVLRAWRLELELAQDAFALLAGIDRSYYGKLERGERQPSLAVLLKCSAAFGKPAAALVEAIEGKLARRRAGAD
ncbi:helix-turn-helix domain-containing protein [Roseateles sp.]|uniref:helix-turn-helix domain-containing protein n=1 Tax=Roseateles sp. TaxID=1971397 RepID=UPI002AA269A9|nr:helix-turn-helix transcriptional regulator [Roseateles sp.]